MINSQQVQQSSVEVVNVDAILDDIIAVVISTANDFPTLGATTSQPE